MAIPIDHAKKVCKPNTLEACAYFSSGSKGMICAKGTLSEAYVKRGLESGTTQAQGDNCPGVIEVKLRIVKRRS